MSRRILITSGKGGVGKTTICVNIGYCLAQKGAKVLLLDADLGLNNLDVLMGIENKVIYDFADIVNGKCGSRQALVQDNDCNNLFVLPSNRACCNLDIKGEILNEVLSQLDGYFDYILIDCPAGMENGFFRALACAHEAIVVTTPHLSSIRDADKIINIISNFDLMLNGIIVNRVRGDLILSNEMLSVEKVEKYLKCNLLGSVPEDDNISHQLIKGGQLKPRAEALLAFGCIVNKLHLGGSVIYDCTKKYKGVLGALKRSIRRWV